MPLFLIPQEIMMDHSLRTISYIADIGDILVLMARRRLIGSPGETDTMRHRKQAKMLCHVFETEEVRVFWYELSIAKYKRNIQIDVFLSTRNILWVLVHQ